MGATTQPAIDASGEGRKLCRQLANELGFRTKDVWYWLTQISLAIESESIHRPSRAVAECWARSMLPAVFDKRGLEPS